MREVDGANELHKANTDYNKDVVRALKGAMRANSTKDYIDYLSGTKRLDWYWRENGMGNASTNGINCVMIKEIVV